VDGDRARCALDDLAASRLAVQPLAADLDRGDHRGDLLDVADEGLEGLAQPLLVDPLASRTSTTSPLASSVVVIVPSCIRAS
jgi:hypothetical protein